MSSNMQTKLAEYSLKKRELKKLVADENSNKIINMSHDRTNYFVGYSFGGIEFVSKDKTDIMRQAANLILVRLDEGSTPEEIDEFEERNTILGKLVSLVKFKDYSSVKISKIMEEIDSIEPDQPCDDYSCLLRYINFDELVYVFTSDWVSEDNPVSMKDLSIVFDVNRNIDFNRGKNAGSIFIACV